MLICYLSTVIIINATYWKRPHLNIDLLLFIINISHKFSELTTMCFVVLTVVFLSRFG